MRSRVNLAGPGSSLNGRYNPGVYGGSVLATVCATCQKSEKEADLLKCPICFKHVCSEHAFHYSGRVFCGKHCADYFFFADPED